MERGSEEYNRIIDQLVDYCNASGSIDQNLYVTYDVKRGLRDSNGKGVLTGLTEISEKEFPQTEVCSFRAIMWRAL